MTAVFLLRSMLLLSVTPPPTTITWSTEVGGAYMGPSESSNSYSAASAGVAIIAVMASSSIVAFSQFLIHL